MTIVVNGVCTVVIGTGIDSGRSVCRSLLMRSLCDLASSVRRRCQLVAHAYEAEVNGQDLRVSLNSLVMKFAASCQAGPNR